MRQRAGAAILLVAALQACVSASTHTGSSTRADNYFARACSLPRPWLRLLDRGYDDVRAAGTDLIAVPKPPNYWGDWTNTAHSGPYGYLQEVPLVFYGPGIVRARGRYVPRRPVDLTNVAATQADMLHYDLDGRQPPIRGVLKRGAPRPKLLITIVIDGAGWNVLHRWPNAWPTLRRLMRAGTSVAGATVGSSPSVTPAVHTNLGTGVYPATHGVTAIVVRAAGGNVVGAFSHEARDAESGVDPSSTLRIPTLADLYDRSHDNVPKVALFGFGNYITGMLGHGGELARADRDIAALAVGGKWTTDKRYYRLPAYVNRRSEPDAHVLDVDRRDGRIDGLWRGHEIEPLDTTPAFAPWENAAVEEVMSREGFGKDRVTDLVYLNYKTPDAAGHRWNMESAEVRDAVASVDSSIGDLVRWLDGRVGHGGYVVTVTADHGQTPLGAGGWAIDRTELLRDLRKALGLKARDRVVEDTNATQVFLDVEGMDQADVTPERIASFMSNYTIGDNMTGREHPAEFDDRKSERIYSAVFPGRRLDQILTCAGLRAR